MRYSISLHRTERKDYEVFADTPHAALKMAKESNPGFSSSGVSELIEDPDEPGQPMEGEYFELVSTCETCDTPILTGDKCYHWSDEDSITTCEKCGGADETHKPSIA